MSSEIFQLDFNYRLLLRGKASIFDITIYLHTEEESRLQRLYETRRFVKRLENTLEEVFAEQLGKQKIKILSQEEKSERMLISLLVYELPCDWLLFWAKSFVKDIGAMGGKKKDDQETYMGSISLFTYQDTGNFYNKLSNSKITLDGLSSEEVGMLYEKTSITNIMLAYVIKFFDKYSLERYCIELYIHNVDDAYNIVLSNQKERIRRLFDTLLPNFDVYDMTLEQKKIFVTVFMQDFEYRNTLEFKNWGYFVKNMSESKLDAYIKDLEQKIKNIASEEVSMLF